MGPHDGVGGPNIHFVTGPQDGVGQFKKILICFVMGPHDGVDSPNQYRWGSPREKSIN